jgi:SRSO17 transposase
MVIKMQLTKTEYDPKLLEQWKKEISEAEIADLLTKYVSQYDEVIKIDSQRMHFENYLKGLMSNLERKSVEPIALKIVGEKGVRPLQQFMKRSPLDDESILDTYQKAFVKAVSSDNGMLSVDSSENAKKGKRSAGVGRQYCGRLGKVENCQSGVFCAYAGENGYGLVDRELYFQEKWFTEEYADLRAECDVPKDKTFQTKNKIALEMVKKAIGKNLLNVKWVGCDAAFGSDHNFLDSLPEGVIYFAGIKSNEQVFLQNGDSPIKVQSLSEDDSFPWQKVNLFEGSKGSVYADTKIIRILSNRTIDKVATPFRECWIYIRKFTNGEIRYFISNAPAEISETELHEAATLRWPIEQCFEECKTFLGMGHFEGRTYHGLLRHWLFVMIAHFFATSLRVHLKKLYQ